jgi:hypothetical protein
MFPLIDTQSVILIQSLIAPAAFPNARLRNYRGAL